MSIIKNTEELNNLLDAVQKLPVKKDEQEKVVDITENGTTVVTPDEGMTLGGVTINVEVESGGGEEFIGIRLSDFVNGYATTADLTSILLTDNMRNDQKYFHYMFYENGIYGKLEEVYLPDGLTCFADCMFYRIRQLKHIYGDFSNVNTVIQYAFADTQLEEFPYMPTLETIGSKAFRYCKLKEIKFPTTITSIYSDAFLGCNNLTDIYCPWVEGAVANAPWGATNATIHYNTIYDENGDPIV